MKKIFLPVLLMILLATCCSCKQTPQENKALPGYNRTFIIGLDDNYAPFGFRNEEGELIGFDIDLALELANRMGVGIAFKAIDWNTKEDEINKGNIDIIWSGFNITPEREKQFLFSKPYMENRQVILVAKGKSTGIVSAADLAGKIVGTQLGAPSQYFLNQDRALTDSFGELITYDNYTSAFKALEDGEVDAIISDELVVHYEMNRHRDKFEAIEATVGPFTEVGIGFRKGDTELRDEVQKVFDSMVEDGTAQKISIKWFDADLIRYKK